MNALEFSKKTFSQLDLPNLLINIWDYAFCHCSICSQYQKWCTQVAKEKWQPDFVDFGYVITNIKRQNKSFIILVQFLQQTEIKFMSLLENIGLYNKEIILFFLYKYFVIFLVTKSFFFMLF